MLSTNQITTSLATGNRQRPDLILNTFQRLRENKKEVLLLDGGTGEELMAAIGEDRDIWSAAAVVNSKYHNILGEVHKSFITAGSDAITTNSYGITPGVGFKPGDIANYGATAGRIALESAQSNSNLSIGRTTIVLGSLGPQVESYRPDKVLPHKEAVQSFKIMAEALSPYVDCFLAETMSSFEESVQAVEAISSFKMPIMVSYTLDSTGLIRSGESVVQAIGRLIKFADIQKVNLLAVLFNCSEPEAISLAFDQIHADREFREILLMKNIILGAYANRLTPIASDWSLEGSEQAQPMRNDMGPEVYFEFIKKWNDMGVQILGGCCGISPLYISRISSSLKQLEK